MTLQIQRLDVEMHCSSSPVELWLVCTGTVAVLGVYVCCVDKQERHAWVKENDGL